MILAGTGHRPDKLGREYDLDGPVSKAIRESVRVVLLRERPDEVVSGMALGFDMILAEEAIALGMAVTAAIPFNGQELIWPLKSRERYWTILNACATKHVCAPGGPSNHNHKLEARNRFMIDRVMNGGGKLLAAWDGSAGGTRNAVVYAKSVGCPIIHLKPNLARTIWEVPPP